MVTRIAWFFLGMAACLLAVLVLWVGLQIPGYLRALSPGVLEAAGAGGMRLADEALLQIEFGRPGPAKRMLGAQEELWEQASDPLSAREQTNLVREALSTLEEAHPDYVLSGGADPFFEQFIDLLPRKPAADTGGNVNSLLATQVNRDALSGFLEASSNPAVQRILHTRNLYTLQHFIPVDQPGGEAYEAAVLITALMAQGGHWGPDFGGGFRGLLQEVERGSPDALHRMEALYLAILGAGQRMNWVQLTSWVRVHGQWEDFVRTVSLLRAGAMSPDQIYSAVILSEDGGKVADYLEIWPDRGYEDLAFALAQGRGALRLLLEEMLPVYRPPAWKAWLPVLETDLPGRFAYRFPEWAFLCSLLLYGLAGVLIYNGIRWMAPPFTGRIPWFSRLAGNSAAALLVVVVMLSANEPYLFSQQTTEPGRLFLEFELTAEASHIQKDNMDISNIDQITVLVLLVFFLVQLFIYTVCLFKVSQINRVPVSPALKLRLLENEEYLFDLGLYVGLTGTVISLLMLALGVVQASLVAAYSSTLFGIVFVALLKILHVRPMKRRLLMDAERY